jgi:hypothetical protein
LVTGERTRGSVTFERLGRRRGREGKRRGERGVRPWGCHTARVGPGSDRRAAYRPCPGRPRQLAARTGDAPMFQKWRADVADAWASAVSVRGSEKSEARAHVGRPG